ncbi:tripartite tricarboxylate transporter TctB family protein [Arthrobacter gandavensis]|uniref:tripartite tricarboxylate transporter TctB family protein n=1 Tax=Arthrobacter gandavensis TaxID=169960 RepID=UPI00188F50F2|nr:tripartite tricarboxylate transporter TctB family protein [Arthrobacter gandavensis]MBF4992713.1 tripartite tricarboxylate transporter TctB family protein [Arthrobacter gandavensis]
MSNPVPPPAPATEPQRTETADAGQTSSRTSWWDGRSGLLLSLLMVLFSTYLLIGILTMDVGETDFPGPKFFPGILMIAGYVLAVLLALHYLRSPERPQETSAQQFRTFTDWTAVLWAVGGFLLFALSLERLGWIIAGAMLFWFVARGFGSRRPLFDISFALLFSSAVYLAFTVGLGLNLPSGILGGGF